MTHHVRVHVLCTCRLTYSTPEFPDHSGGMTSCKLGGICRTTENPDDTSRLRVLPEAQVKVRFSVQLLS